MKKTVFLIVACIALSCMTAYAECTTSVSGTINNETWTPEGSPYCVEGDVTVVSLIIEPGVIVEVTDDYEFEVSGTLTAEGTADDVIEFKKSEGIVGWKGISILDSSLNSSIVYCTISGYSSGGLKIINSTPEVRNSYLVGNEGAESGTGLYVTLSTSLTDHLVVENSTISNHLTYDDGAGVLAQLSAGSMVLRNCSISNNTSTYESTGTRRGAGIWTTANGGLEIENCKISGNSTYSRCSGTYCSVSTNGGGIYISQGNVSLKNSTISSNLAAASNSGSWSHSYAYGGGVFNQTGDLHFINSIISNNSVTASSSYFGGGVYNSLGAADLTNCTIVSNVPNGIETGTGATQLRNCIVYSNTVGQISGSANVSFCDVQGGFDGEGNIDTDPLFKDVFTYQVYCEYSPCTDAGNAYPWYNDSCFPPSCGTERNDIGAYGGPDACGWCAYDGSFLLGPCSVPSVGDFDADGDVDPVDLFIFSGNYGNE